MLQVKPGYKPQAEDTSIETDAYEFSLLRQKTNSDRFLMAAACTSTTRRFCISGLCHQYPDLAEKELAPFVAKAFLGLDLIHFQIKGTLMTWIQDSNQLAILMHRIFEATQIPYYITGGVAASTYGDPRSTRDLDIVFTLEKVRLPSLVAALESSGFYVPGVDDLSSGRMQTLGITHQETIARCDLVLAQDTEFDRVKFTRRTLINIVGYGSVYFASPEDVILNKLRWGKQSQSEKQWRDVLGVLKIQGQNLDFTYLRQWAEPLGMMEDLNRAIVEAGL
jgi:hypothetical protein